MAQEQANVNTPYSTENKDEEEKLLQPFTYIVQAPSKNIRTILARTFNYWLNIPAEKLREIENIIELLHNASLLLDDIEDNSVLRRGIPVAHSIYGVGSTINAANYVIIIALKKCIELGHPDATIIYTEQLLELHRGQGMEIYWRDNFTCPTEQEYEIMTKRKTGGLFMLAVRLMQLFSENKADFSKLGGLLGLYFQVNDDYINLNSKDYMENKSYCEDLTEGKFGFPLIHAIQSHPEDNKVMRILLKASVSKKKCNINSLSGLIEILKQRTKDKELKKYCVSLLEKYGSFEYTKNKLMSILTEITAEATKFGSNPHMDELLETFYNLQNQDKKQKK